MKRLQIRPLYVVGAIAALPVSFAILIRTSILPPLEVLRYQLSMSPRPIISGQSLNIKGWGWYPISTEDKTERHGKSVTFVQFLPFVDPSKRPITFTAREEIANEEFFLAERKYPWGSAKLIKPNVLPEQTSYVAWLPNQRLYVATNSESVLLETLPMLDLSKN